MKYEDSGVNIEKGKRAKEAISRHVKSTWTADVLSETGAFGGLYALGDRCREPVLVSSMDGVGTKIIIALVIAAVINRDFTNLEAPCGTP